MAKEMMIVFVYDTLRCQSEWDDPAEAVLYFHPGWVSDSQRHALSGQIVGAAHCVASILSQPTAITLQSGKFLIREYGRYLLAVGSDRNIPDWVLKNRTDLLTSMIKVYHGDLATIAAQFPGENNPRFSEKLYQMFETYLPILQFGCHIFQRVPMFNLPKSATSIYMEAMQVLEHCQRIKGMLGGVILYNNKILASQLSPKLTSHLAVVDPYRIKSPAEQCPTQTPLPLGAQLLLVYMSKNEYKKLKNDATKMQLLSGGSEEIVEQFKKNVELAKSSKEFMPSGMKRDKSLLFTAVPEEDCNLISPPFAYSEKSIAGEVEKAKVNMPDVVPFTSKPRPRPTKLSLSFKNCVQSSLDEEVTEKQEPERKFTGQTSVCSTPMLEYKRLHGNVLSICQNPESSIINRVLNADASSSQPDILKTNDGNSNGKEIVHKNTYREVDDVITNYVSKPEVSRKLGSVNDIQDTFKRFSQKATKKLKQIRDGVTRDSSSPSPDLSKSAEYDKNMYMTITDPSYPVFRNDGMPISKSLYNTYLEQHYRNMNEEDIAENMFSFNTRVAEQEKALVGFDSDMVNSPKHTPKKVAVAKVDPSIRKSLSLPLKPLNDNPEESQSNQGQHSNKRLAGVQLTPLMEKLSYLAFSEKSSGYSSRVMTPLDLKDFPTPGLERNVTFSDSSGAKRAAISSDSDSESEDELQVLADYSSRGTRVALFVSGLQNMALMVLMDQSAADDAQAIHTLWETSLNNLGPIEQKCMEPFTTLSESAEYSYLTLDPDWGTVAKGGPWASLDIATMGLIHHHFAEDNSVSEIILRTEESVVLGTTCGGAEVYYQENGAKQPGLPMPADAMSTVQLKAKRRLHRDHSVVIL